MKEETKQSRYDKKQRANNKFKFTTWADETWRGTEALEKLKERLAKPRVTK
jgi:hypothetical protein